MTQSTLRTPLGAGMTLERTLGPQNSLTITITAGDGTVLFSEELKADAMREDSEPIY